MGGKSKLLRVDLETYERLVRLASALNITKESLVRLLVHSVDVVDVGGEVTIYVYGGESLRPRRIRVIEGNVMETLRACREQIQKLMKEKDKCVEAVKEVESLRTLVRYLSSYNKELHKELEQTRVELSNCQSHLIECKRRCG